MVDEIELDDESAKFISDILSKLNDFIKVDDFYKQFFNDLSDL